MSYQNNKRKILAKVDNVLEDKLAVVGEVVAGSAKANCPVETGRLKSSISWKLENGDGGGFDSGNSGDEIEKPDNKLTAKIGTNVDYAKFVELGVRGSDGKAMLRDGLNKNRTQIKKILAL